MADLTRVHVLIHGRVQGVGFRFWTQQSAREYRLTGWVRNRSDGCVEAVLEGGRSEVEAMLSRLKQGPAAARVDRCETEFEEYTGECTDFEIRPSERIS